MPGVAFAHGFGIVHGNLNPSNILLPDYGPIKILNFGLIHLFGGYHRSDNFEARYLSPEQIGGSPSDMQSDIYSLGMIFYEAIAGKTPADFYSSSHHQASKPENELIPIPPSLLLADIPEWLDDFLLRMIAPNPAARYRSVKHAMRVLDDHCLRLEDVVESRKAESGVRARNTIVRSSANAAKPGDRRQKSSTNLASKVESRVEKSKVDYSSRKESADSPRTRGPTQDRVSRTRYAHVSVLLLLIASALIVETELRSQSSLTEDVDSMFERINSDSMKKATAGQKELIGRKEASSSRAKVTSVWPQTAANGSTSREAQLKLERLHDQRLEAVLRKPQIQKPRADAKRDAVESRSEPPLLIHSNLPTEPTVSREQNLKDQPKAIEPTKLTEYRPMKSELKVSWEN
jgi:serine/threonine-protein kinase